MGHHSLHGMALCANVSTIREAHMIFKQMVLPIIAAALLLAVPVQYSSAQASEFAATDHASADTSRANAVKANASQPYIVQKGDTLWDIAHHFFRNPRHWLKIWEHNLYITNPDLIYPGNKIWFDGHSLKQGGLTTVQPQPQIIVRPVERLEVNTDSSLLLTALQRQGFIQPGQVQGVGYIVDSSDDRLNYGAHDLVYLKLNQPAKVGTLFDIFRSTDTLHDPHDGHALGVLIRHMGQIRISSVKNGIYRGRVEKAFEEISRGDRLKLAQKIDPHLVPSRPDLPVSGTVIYIRNGSHEAAQHQVIGINMGLDQGLKAGMQLAIYKAGRLVSDNVGGGHILLPQEQIGELMVLVVQPQAAIALITKSTAPINLGDAIKKAPVQ